MLWLKGILLRFAEGTSKIKGNRKKFCRSINSVGNKEENRTPLRICRQCVETQ